MILEYIVIYFWTTNMKWTSETLLQQEVTLPCDFDSYDTNKDGTVTSAEFLAVSHGFTKVRPDAIFARIDTNRKYVKRIGRGHWRHMNMINLFIEKKNLKTEPHTFSWKSFAFLKSLLQTMAKMNDLFAVYATWDDALRGASRYNFTVISQC